MYILYVKQIVVNIFHFFALETNAIWKIVCNNPNTQYIAFLQNFENNGVHKWRKDLLTTFLPTFASTEEFQEYCKQNNSYIKSIVNVQYNGWIIDPWTFVKYEPSQESLPFARTVKQSLRIENKLGVYATFVTRRKSRILRDKDTNTLLEPLFEEMCRSYKIPYKVACFDDISFEEQASILADTKVMLSCHGAGNTNVFLLPNNGHLMEINFRKHWFCDPVCDEHFHKHIPYNHKCKGELTWRPYFHKADYHNLSLFFGKKYTELELSYVDGYIDRNPINVREVFVDAKYILEQVRKAMQT